MRRSPTAPTPRADSALKLWIVLARAFDAVERHSRASIARFGLGTTEFGVLEVLLAAGGTVVSSEELLERVWDENADPFTTTVRVTVMTLRKKLGEPGIIDTVVGSGYRVPAAGQVGVEVDGPVG